MRDEALSLVLFVAQPPGFTRPLLAFIHSDDYIHRGRPARASCARGKKVAPLKNADVLSLSNVVTEGRRPSTSYDAL